MFRLTCWAEPEPSISQHHEQRFPAEKRREAQRDVSVLCVRIIPSVACSAAEPPQQESLQPCTHKKVMKSQFRMTQTRFYIFKAKCRTSRLRMYLYLLLTCLFIVLIHVIYCQGCVLGLKHSKHCCFVFRGFNS